jgi:hypothetical protein
MKNKTFSQIFIIYLRYLIGFSFVFASIVKIQGLRFTAESGAENPINSAFHFFETLYQSGIYWKFLGIGQLLAGFLLMTQRYAKLGALLFLPIITNVFFITISYDFNYTYVITSLMLFANLFLILWDWNTFKVLINKTPKYETKQRLEFDNTWQVLGLFLFLLTIISRLLMTQDNFIYIFLSFPLIGLIGLIVGYRRRKLY